LENFHSYSSAIYFFRLLLIRYCLDILFLLFPIFDIVALFFLHNKLKAKKESSMEKEKRSHTFTITAFD